MSQNVPPRLGIPLLVLFLVVTNTYKLQDLFVTNTLQLSHLFEHISHTIQSSIYLQMKMTQSVSLFINTK